MSLTSFLDMRDVNDRVKPLRPKLPRKITAPLQAEPRSNRYSMVGTAFDYLLRFELQRRAPHAMAEKWIAEHAPDMLWNETGKGAGGLDPFFDLRLEAELTGGDMKLYPHSDELARRARQIVDNARAAVAAFLKTDAPKHTQLAELAAHAVRLAKLDDVYRALRLDPRFEEAGAEDVDDLLAMLEIVPFDSLLHDNILLLNPTFGETSHLVGGADTDLITGDLLVDFKVTKKAEMNVKNLDQLLGYFLLARHLRRVDAKFPEIKRVALYFCRHGHLWVLDVSMWTEHAAFPEIEEWFFKRAKEVFGASGAATKSGIASREG